jgi:hypothetical protein
MLTCKYWYTLDGRGNMVALTDATGTVVDRYSYDVWGLPTISLGTSGSRCSTPATGMTAS